MQPRAELFLVSLFSILCDPLGGTGGRGERRDFIMEKMMLDLLERGKHFL